jgi:ABC-type nitrate/sulfonate/bicarbonate transport system permease component
LNPSAGEGMFVATRRRLERETRIWPAWLRGRRLRLTSVLLLIATWYGITETGLVNSLFLPTPGMVIRAGIHTFATGELVRDIKATLIRVGEGFTLGGATGTLIGLWLAQSRVASLAVRPILELLRPIPGLAWAPLLLIWFGIGEAGKVVLIAYATFFPVFTNTLDGVATVPSHAVLAARTLGAKGRHIFLRVLLPSSLPNILTGLSIGMGQAFGIVVAAELIAATEGMGWMISDARRFFRTDLVVLGMLLIGIFGFMCVQVLVQLQRHLLHWHVSDSR